MCDSENIDLILLIFIAGAYLPVQVFSVKFGGTIADDIVFDLFLIVRTHF